MTNKTDKSSSKESKLIKAKFALGPDALAADLARQDAARAKARKAAPCGKTGKGKARSAAARDVGIPSAGPERKFYPDFPLGKFDGEPHLVWLKPDIFRHEPNPDKPFRFIRQNGEIIEPGPMFTDGGSIPRALWFVKDLSPWSYAPAFLIHDWLFDLHHCNKTDKGFEEVRDILMEGVRTLMESGVCDSNRLSFDLIYSGVDSFVAHHVWDNQGCQLP
jgi:hypothetical protein